MAECLQSSSTEPRVYKKVFTDSVDFCALYQDCSICQLSDFTLLLGNWTPYLLPQKMYRQLDVQNEIIFFKLSKILTIWHIGFPSESGIL